MDNKTINTKIGDVLIIKNKATDKTNMYLNVTSQNDKCSYTMFNLDTKELLNIDVKELTFYKDNPKYNLLQIITFEKYLDCVSIINAYKK